MKSNFLVFLPEELNLTPLFKEGEFTHDNLKTFVKTFANLIIIK